MTLRADSRSTGGDGWERFDRERLVVLKTHLGADPREVEVLYLVARGLTDAKVAEQLVISPRTINSHLESIYGKIVVSSHSAVTRYAIEHQLP